MHYQAYASQPTMVPFNTKHKHKHFQLCLVETRRADKVTSRKVFVSCPREGLSMSDIEAYLVNCLDADESLEREVKGDHWVWDSEMEALIRVTTLDTNHRPSKSCPVFSIDDTELQMYRKYCPEQFEYSI